LFHDIILMSEFSNLFTEACAWSNLSSKPGTSLRKELVDSSDSILLSRVLIRVEFLIHNIILMSEFRTFRLRLGHELGSMRQRGLVDFHQDVLMTFGHIVRKQARSCRICSSALLTAFYCRRSCTTLLTAFYCQEYYENYTTSF